MLARFRTPESLLVLAAALLVTLAVCLATHQSPGWTVAFCLFAVLGVGVPLAVSLQDRLLVRDLAAGRFDRALRTASAIRDSARTPAQRDLAEFDLGLVHLARGAPADAKRSFGRIERHRIQPKRKLLVALYQALSQARSEPSAESAAALKDAADAALAEFGEDPQVLAIKAEAHLLQGDGDTARALFTRSLDLDPDPSDPSPGERYVLFARAALQTGAPDVALKSLRVAAGLRADGPFVRAARAELAQLEPNA